MWRKLWFLTLVCTLSGGVSNKLYAQSKFEREVIHAFKGFIKSFEALEINGVHRIMCYDTSSTLMLGPSFFKGLEIKQYFEQTLHGITKVNHIRLSDVQTNRLNRNTILLTCVFEESLQLISGKTVSYTGTGQYVFKKIKQQWKITHSAGAVKCP